MDLIVASKILGIDYDDTLKNINKKYKKLLFKYHPDYNNNPQSNKEFITLKQAYDFVKALFLIYNDSEKFYDIIISYYNSKGYKDYFFDNINIQNDGKNSFKKTFFNSNFDEILEGYKNSYKSNVDKSKKLNLFLSKLLISLSGLLYFIFLYNRVDRNNPLVNKNFWEYKIELVDWKKNSLFKLMDKAIEIYPYYSKDLFTIKNLIIDLFSFFKIYNNNTFPQQKFSGLIFILHMQLKKSIYTVMEQVFFTDLLFKKTLNRNLERQRIKNILVLFKKIDKLFIKLNISEAIKDNIISDIIVMKELINNFLLFRKENIVFPIPSDIVLTWYYNNL